MSNWALEVLDEAAKRFNDYAAVKLPLPLNPREPLATQKSSLDSLALMTFIMEVEEVMTERRIYRNLTEGNALSHFDTVGDLVAYMEGIAGD
jgi:acyl carrier protein